MAHDDLGFVEDKPSTNDHSDLGFVEDGASTTPGRSFKSKLIDAALGAITPGHNSLAAGFWRDGLSGAKQALQAQAESYPSLEEYQARHANDTFGQKMKSVILGDPDSPVVHGSPPTALPAEAAPSALLALSQALTSSTKARVATNAAIGGVTGAMKTPQPDESRAENGLIGALLSLVPSAALEASAKLSPMAGAKLTNLNKGDATTYAENPKLAEELYSNYSNAPESLNNDLADKLKGALNSIYEQKTAPLLDTRGKILSGDAKGIAIAPDQFAGTAAEPEIKRIFQATGPDPDTMATAFGPQSSGEASLPDRLRLTGAQGQRVKQILQDAADYSSTAAKLNPLEYAAKSEADAIAASRMRKALEGGFPGISDINEEIGRNATMSKLAKSLLGSNPSRILNPSESIGNTNVRALQNFLDENAGTQFGSMADSLAAGKAMNSTSRIHGLWDKLVADPIGRRLLGSSAALSDIAENPLIPSVISNAGTKSLSDEEVSAVQRRLAKEKGK